MDAQAVTSPFRTLAAAAVYAAAALAVGVALGVPRELYLAPRITSDLAVVAETPLMALAIWLIARPLVQGFALKSAAARAAMGGLALIAVLVVEDVLNRGLHGESVFAHWALYGYLAGAANLAGLAWFALAPLCVRPRARLDPRPA